LAAATPAHAARARRAAPPPRRAPPPPRAADGDKPAGGVDWDAAWSVFRRRVRSSVDVNPPVGGGGPSTAPRPLSSRPRRLAVDDIRRDERLLLDVWSSQWFQALMVVVTLAVLYGFLKVGPPPSDGRCTLPWC